MKDWIAFQDDMGEFACLLTRSIKLVDYTTWKALFRVIWVHMHVTPDYPEVFFA